MKDKKDLNTKKNNETGYSFWGIIATIVSTVIGAGIFFKAESVINITGSGSLSILVWIIGSIIIGCLLLSYLEIASSTAKTGEVGSLSTWTNKFFNVKFAKIVGLFITFIYFPTVIILLTSISIKFIMDAMGVNFGKWEEFAFIFTMIPLLITATYGLNLLTKNGGERWQMVGTCVKFIPFFIIVVVGFFMAVTGSMGDLDFDGDTNKAATANGFFLAMPAILFSFDGFIYSTNLQNEMKEKDKKKLPKAMIISLIIICVTYISVAIMLVWIGDVGIGFNIPAVLNKMFGGQKWISVIFLVIISISALTGMNGFAMFSMQSFKSLSEDNIIPDKNNVLVKRDKNNISKNSTYAMLIAVAIWFVIFIIAELVMSAIDPAHSWISIIDSTVVSSVIIVSFVYGVIVIGGMHNRKTNKVDVEQMKWFIPLAVVGSVGMIFASLYNITAIILAASGMTSMGEQMGAIMTLVIIALEALTVIVIYCLNERYIKNNEPEKIIKKETKTMKK